MRRVNCTDLRKVPTHVLRKEVAPRSLRPELWGMIWPAAVTSVMDAIRHSGLKRLLRVNRRISGYYQPADPACKQFPD